MRVAACLLVGAVAILASRATADDRLDEALFGYSHTGSFRLASVAMGVAGDGGAAPCGTSIHGRFVLLGDVDCAGSSIAFDDGATLDLNGFVLANALFAFSANKVTIKRGTLQHAIFLINGGSVTFKNLA